MCGIAGFQGDFDPRLVRAMGEAIAHRGPDGGGELMLPGPGPRGAVALVHRRLAIIDLSAEGAQPMTVSCPCCGARGADDLALVFNGEIYNFAELRRELEGQGHAFHSRTDSEVLLHLYARDGTAMLERLNGMFAFAIRDGRERGRPPGVQRGDVLLARDQLGVKPLYVARRPEGVLFASEIKALLRAPGLPRDLDHVALHQNLAYLWTPAPRTLLAAVEKVRPGYAMLLRNGAVVREWGYYDLPYGGEPLAARSEADVAAEVAERVREAVRRQMVADVPVGAFLSGGLDSSAVVAMMRQVDPERRPVCYCIGFPPGVGVDGAPPDLPFARRVAGHLDVDLRTIEVQPSMIDELERMLYHLDEPQADPAPIHALLIARQARQDGIKVLLSGAGGDDIFTGYRRHHALRLERAWGWMPRAARAALARGAERVGARSTSARRVTKAFAHAGLDPETRTVAYFWWSGEQMRRALYAPALAGELAGEETAAPLLASLARIPTERDRLNRMLYLEAKHFLADHNLNYTDKTGMAFGVEARVPLLDLDLVELATRIPTAMKQKGRVGKAIFKRAMEPYLPHDVVYREKSGFGAPLRRWLRQELRERLEETLSPASLARRGLFDPAAVRRLIDADRAGRVDGSYTLFALMCTELWCRMFVDGAAVP